MHFNTWFLKCWMDQVFSHVQISSVPRVLMSVHCWWCQYKCLFRSNHKEKLMTIFSGISTQTCVYTNLIVALAHAVSKFILFQLNKKASGSKMYDITHSLTWIKMTWTSRSVETTFISKSVQIIIISHEKYVFFITENSKKIC